MSLKRARAIEAMSGNLFFFLNYFPLLYVGRNPIYIFVSKKRDPTHSLQLSLSQLPAIVLTVYTSFSESGSNLTRKQTPK
jgi:hypothetical protein